MGSTLLDDNFFFVALLSDNFLIRWVVLMFSCYMWIDMSIFGCYQIHEHLSLLGCRLVDKN